MGRHRGRGQRWTSHRERLSDRSRRRRHLDLGRRPPGLGGHTSLLSMPPGLQPPAPAIMCVYGGWGGAAMPVLGPAGGEFRSGSRNQRSWGVGGERGRGFLPAPRYRPVVHAGTVAALGLPFRTRKSRCWMDPHPDQVLLQRLSGKSIQVVHLTLWS